MNRDEKEALYFKSLLIRLRKDAAVRVESVADIDFWESTLSSTLPHLKFEFFPQSMQNGSGKKEVLLLKNYADRELVLCVDADYDYLLENSDYIGKPFVFHTYVYAIENIFSYAEGLKEVLEKAINTEGESYDFEGFFKNLSNLLYDYLIYFLYSTKINDSNLQSTFKMIGIGLQNQEDIGSLQNDQEYKAIIEEYEANNYFNIFKSRLLKLGLNQDNTYLFINGHHLFDKVIVKKIKEIAYQTLKPKFGRLIELGKAEEIKELNKLLKTKRIIKHLKGNNSFKNSIFYKNIVSDIHKAFN